MAQFSGLTMAIANPSSVELMNVKKASDTLTAKDKSTLSFIEHFSDKSGPTPSSIGIKETASTQEKIAAAIIEGNRENIIALIDQELSGGTKASELVDKIMIPAIVHVGDLYEKKIYFLPQLMAAAEIMKKALGYLEPQLKKTATASKGKVIIATVKGDIHDIGKNIVALLLRNYGYHVIDLGKDVPDQTIIDIVKKENPDVIGLSALMTTTMVNMKELIELARDKGIKTDFMVGGAVVTEAYASSIGASFAKDGVEAVRVVEKLIKK
jgi:5-methyltetrahydrofolate--homocysteine methyltransferase